MSKLFNYGLGYYGCKGQSPENSPNYGLSPVAYNLATRGNAMGSYMSMNKGQQLQALKNMNMAPQRHIDINTKPVVVERRPFTDKLPAEAMGVL